MRWVPIALAGSLVAAAGVAALANGSRAATVARVIDRTLVCTTSYIGGSQSVTATAHRGTGRQGSQWLRPAFARLTSGQIGSAFTLLDNSLVWVTAGRPSRDATVVQAPVAGVSYPLRAWGTLAWNTRLCRETSKRIPLTSAGLSGGEVGPFDDAFDCNTPARVRVRIRGTLAAPGAVRSYRQFARITAPLAKAELAVRTESGKPLSYAAVLASGKARLVTAKSCTPGG